MFLLRMKRIASRRGSWSRRRRVEWWRGRGERRVRDESSGRVKGEMRVMRVEKKGETVFSHMEPGEYTHEDLTPRRT
jgi:hypothetical protein